MSQQENAPARRASKKLQVLSEQEDEDSDDSSSSQDSSSESSSRVARRSREKQVAKQSKSKPTPRKQESPKNPKSKWVYQILKRWWYVLPPWPPVDFDYEKALKSKGYRAVSHQDWRKQPQTLEGLRKAEIIQGYRGVYKTKDGLVDIRPKEGIPSYQRLMELGLVELKGLAMKAVQKQLEVLQKEKNVRPGMVKDLKRLIESMK